MAAGSGKLPEGHRAVITMRPSPRRGGEGEREDYGLSQDDDREDKLRVMKQVSDRCCGAASYALPPWPQPTDAAPFCHP